MKPDISQVPAGWRRLYPIPYTPHAPGPTIMACAGRARSLYPCGLAPQMDGSARKFRKLLPPFSPFWGRVMKTALHASQ